MGRRCLSAKQARSILWLEKVEADLSPPEFGGVVRDAIREAAEEQLVSLIAADVCEPRRAPPR
ncbi:MAG: hypothetical protein LBM75_04640 [Myxococcales bacterium]|nr:hypothetical protein [Myxococcales bacterium]